MSVVEQALIAQLRLVPAGGKPHLGDIRRAIATALGEFTQADLQRAIDKLRLQGKLVWGKLELSPSMRAEISSPATQGPALNGSARETPRLGEEAGVAHAPASDRPLARELYQRLIAEGERRGMSRSAVSRAVYGNDAQMSVMRTSAGAVRQRTLDKALAWLAGAAPPDPDPYPGEVNDAAATASPFSATGKTGGRHAAATRAAARPVPVPAHEPEVARQVREEATAAGLRRRNARSTGTVSRPLELRLPDMSLVETIATVLAEQPHDLVAVIANRHAAAWKRILQLGRANGWRPSQALYAALEAGLAQLEASAAPKLSSARG